MLGFFKLTALFFVSVVAAQSSTTGTASAAVPTSTAGIDQCILTCSQQAATDSGCVSFTNQTCVCSSQQFQNAARSCLQQNCTEADLATAEGLQSAVCSGASASGSGTSSGSLGPTATGPGPISISTTDSVTSPSGSPSAGDASGSNSGTASASTSTGASVGKFAYTAVFGKELGALALSGVGALLGGALLL